MPDNTPATLHPHAQPLGVEHEGLIEPALADLRRPLGERALSDLSFRNLYLFRAAHDYRYVPGPYPCIAGYTYDGAPHLIPLFPLEAAPPAALAALLMAGECFYPLAAETVASLSADIFESASIRQDADYLYAASQFIDYGSRRLRAQRNASRRLQDQYPLTQHPLRQDGRQDALEVLERWRTEKRVDLNGADLQACREAVLPREGLTPLEGLIFYVEGRAAGFVLTEELNPGVSVVRFAKGLAEFDGIYPFMFQQLCASMTGRLHWLNFEQDLGKENFRKSKLSYSPTRLLEKFRVRPRDYGSS